MTDVNQFLAQRTQLCERQSARITPDMCRVCRDRGDAFCVGCRGLVPVYPLSSVLEEEMSTKKVKPCVMCHREMEIAGRGMCGKCYAVELKREKSSKGAPPLKPMTSVIADAGFNRVNAVETVPKPAEAGREWAECSNCAYTYDVLVHNACPKCIEIDPDASDYAEQARGELQLSEPTQIIPKNIPFGDYPCGPPPVAKWAPVDTAYSRAETMRQLLAADEFHTGQRDPNDLFDYDCPSCGGWLNDEGLCVDCNESYPQTPEIPEHAPFINPLLVVDHRYRLVFPDDVAQRLRSQGVQPEHIIELVVLGMDGRLELRP